MTAYRAYAPICKVDAEQRMVYGYASTEARDDQNEIVTKSALESALDDYMKFANIREMHQPSAVGVAKQAAMDGRGLYVAAKVVDNAAWEKVREGVYKGFSIGGRVTERAAGDPNTITGLRLNEISLVDRPANPEAVFDCWKAAEPGEKPAAAEPATETQPAMVDTAPAPETPMAEALRKASEEKAAREAARAAGPIQKWIASDGVAFASKAEAVKHDLALAAEEEARAAAAPALAAADALAAAVAKAAEKPANPDADDPARKGGDAPGDGSKPYGDEDYADPGYQADGKKRYPLTEGGKPSATRIRAAWNYIHKKKNAGKYSADHLAAIKKKIVAAWKAHIDKDGPPEADDGKKAAAADDLRKSLWDVGRLACILQDLHWMCENLRIEAVMEGDAPTIPARIDAAVKEICGILNALVAEETAEIAADDKGDDRAAALGLAAIAETLKKGDALSVQQIAQLDSIRKKAAAPASPDNETAGRLAALEKIVADLGAGMQNGASTIARLAEENASLKAEVKKLADTPLPPKTVKVPDGYTVIDKNGVPDQPALPSLSPEDAQRALAALPAEQRDPIVLAMIQASLKQPVNLMRR